LRGYFGEAKKNADILRKEIAYFQTRLLKLNYAEIKRKRFALGSGAVESPIRRVIDLRIKSPSMFWDYETFEAMLHLRCGRNCLRIAGTRRWIAFANMPNFPDKSRFISNRHPEYLR